MTRNSCDGVCGLKETLLFSVVIKTNDDLEQYKNLFLESKCYLLKVPNTNNGLGVIVNWHFKL